MRAGRLLFSFLFFVALSAIRAQDYDVAIRGGRVIDPESGFDRVANVGVRNGRITYVGPNVLRAKQEIDATGLVVAPGFIDIHRHAHGANSWRYQALDGVTTSLELEIGTADVDAWYNQAAAAGPPVNVGVAVGHVPVRMKVLGDSGFFLPTGPAASADLTNLQRLEMTRLIDAGLARGALAVGMGLAYTPAASTMEALEVFRIASRNGVPVHLHLRGGGMTALVEAIGYAAITGAPLHVAHVNSTGGRNVEFFLAAIEDGRKRGLDITTEAYPYTAGATLIQSALYSNWESQPDAWFTTLQWAATGERLTRETFRKYRAQGGSVISHSGTEDALLLALKHPLTMIVSDGGRNEKDEPTHPRATGPFSRILGHYVRDTAALDLKAALAKMTWMPAQRLEKRAPDMKDRGRIRVGAFADITMFDAGKIIDRSTYTNAAIASTGVIHVLVNGVAVVRDGRIVEGVSPGRAIRGPMK
jgi:N-acyl-D-aspartate/D-glutamate deacylase